MCILYSVCMCVCVRESKIQDTASTASRKLFSPSHKHHCFYGRLSVSRACLSCQANWCVPTTNTRPVSLFYKSACVLYVPVRGGACCVCVGCMCVCDVCGGTVCVLMYV